MKNKIFQHKNSGNLNVKLRKITEGEFLKSPIRKSAQIKTEEFKRQFSKNYRRNFLQSGEKHPQLKFRRISK